MTESPGKLLESKGEQHAFKKGAGPLEELTLIIEKFVGNSPTARSLSEMREKATILGPAHTAKRLVA